MFHNTDSGLPEDLDILTILDLFFVVFRRTIANLAE